MQVACGNGILVQRRLRLTRNEDINHVRQAGRSLVNPFFVLGYLPNHVNQNRIAVIAGRAVGGAVQRNFAKRRLRSAIQTLLPNLDQGFDLVLIARKPILDVDFPELVDRLRSMTMQAGLLKDEVN